jgi:FAD synthase
MKQYVTLVFEYETADQLATIRELAGAKQCRAWSMDHEMVRVDLIRQAVEDGDIDKATEYVQADGIMALLPELRSCA